MMVSRTSLVIFLLTILITLVCVRSCSTIAQADNGFDLSNASISKKEILPGGPPRDGIPAIDKPNFLKPWQVGGLDDSEHVLSLTIGDVTRAYPIAILNWHEIVNDQINGQPVVISYCPLCGTGMAFSAQVNGQALQFGVSGLLYNSDVLLYDRATESLWSQLKTESVSGPMVGKKLQMLPLNQMTWGQWKENFPQGDVLSRETGYLRNYDASPYGHYDESPVIYFPVEFLSRAYHPKERVLGIEVDGLFKAYPFAELAKYGGYEVQDQFNGINFKIKFDAETRTGEVVYAETGVSMPAVNAFWFAWFTFHPQTDVFQSP